MTESMITKVVLYITLVGYLVTNHKNVQTKKSRYIKPKKWCRSTRRTDRDCPKQNNKKHSVKSVANESRMSTHLKLVMN